MAIAEGTAKALGAALAALRWPSLAMALVPVVPILGLGVVLFTLSNVPARVAVGVPLAVAAAVEVLFVVRRRAYLRAAREQDALAREFRALLSIAAVSAEVLSLMRTVAARGGALLLRRLRAAWSLIRLPDHLAGRVEDYPRARLFIPPAVAFSGTLVLAQVYLTVLSWPVLVLVVVLRLTGVLT